MSEEARELPGLGAPKRARAVLGTVASAGVALWAAGLWLEPVRAWASLLTMAYVLLSIALGALCFVALQHIGGARWSIPIRRVAEAIGTTLAAGALLLLPVAIGLHTLYHWTHPGDDPVLAAKAWWLSQPFFLVRAVLYLAIWAFLGSRLWAESVAQDQSRSAVHTQRNVRWSVVYLVAFAITYSGASFDWIMSLDPHWASTLFAVHQFSGAILSALALLAVVVILLRRSGALRERVSDSHLHDLGRFLFGFSSFWAYLWFCQLMLIWYANIPEETHWVLRQWHGGWGLVSGAVPVLLWVVPFFGLMRRSSKRSERALLHVAAAILVGRVLEVGATVFPALGLPLSLGAAEIGAGVIGSAALCWTLSRRLSKASLVPIGDPGCADAARHHVGHAM